MSRGRRRPRPGQGPRSSRIAAEKTAETASANDRPTSTTTQEVGGAVGPHPPRSVANDNGKTCPWEQDQERTWPQVVVLVVLFVVGTFLGFLYKPPASADPSFPGNLVVEVPPSAGDGSTSVPINGVAWIEAHGQRIAGYEPAQLGMPSKPSQDTVRVMLSLRFADQLPEGTTVSVNFDLPGGATLALCRGLPIPHCVQQPSPHQQAGRSEQVVAVESTFVPGDKGNAVIVVADLTGVKGMNFVESRTRAVVRYPMVALAPPPAGQEASEPQYAIDVVTEAVFKDASTVRWSQLPGNGLQAGGPRLPNPAEPPADTDSVGWAYPLYEGTSHWNPPPITGANSVVSDNDATRLFVAGVFFGVAGAAAIAAIQALVIGLDRRRKALRSAVWRQVRRRGG